MDQGTYDRLASKARRLAARRLQELYNEQYSKLIAEEREKLGLPERGSRLPEGDFGRYIVLAGRRDEFIAWCRSHDIQPNGKRVVYVGSVQRLAGLELSPQDTIVTTGTFMKRHDAAAIFEQVQVLEKTMQARMYGGKNG